MAGGRGFRLLAWIGVPVLAVVLLIAFWSWAWFIPLVERQASAALGRPVTVGGLGVDLGRVTGITLTDLVVKNPEGFAPAEPPLATVPRLVVQLDVMEFIRHRRIVIPDIAVERPSLRLLADAEGRNNYTFDFGAPEGETAAPADPAAEPAIGALRIQDGQAHVTLAKLRADMQLRIGTEEPPGEQPRIRVAAEGRYANQPITGTLLGGAVLSLRDAANPWPVQLDLANGPTKVSLKGTVQNPLKFAGADLRLELSGPDMALLTPLTGVPVPPTPAYRVAGRLDYAESHIRFTGMEGKVGRSDLNGDIRVDPRPARPVVTADLQSRQVDLDDLAGFIGADPGDKPAAARSGRRGRVLPDDPVNLPKLEAADIHLTYKGARILGRAMPLDDLQVKLDIENGAIALHPLRFGVNGGKIEGNFDFTPVARGGLRAKGEIQFQRVDVSRLLGVTNVAEGQGRLGGKAVIDTQGASLAQMLGQGNGSLSLAFSGGNLSALLVDISGLRLGNAILSALGLPTRTQVQCFVADMALRRGVLSTRTVLLDTDDALVSGMGDIDLGEEKLNYALRTEAKHFSIGDLPTDIQIRGTFANPAVRPEMLELGARAGAAVGLGIIALPLALLPTIQFGIGEDNRCENLTRRRR
jgi:uncharacterized protein involved in outer membrane biogenesis